MPHDNVTQNPHVDDDVIGERAAPRTPPPAKDANDDVKSMSREDLEWRLLVANTEADALREECLAAKRESKALTDNVTALQVQSNATLTLGRLGKAIDGQPALADVLLGLAWGVERARKIHPEGVSIRNVVAEAGELANAEIRETPERCVEEALDLLVVVARYLLGETTPVASASRTAETEAPRVDVVIGSTASVPVVTAENVDAILGEGFSLHPGGPTLKQALSPGGTLHRLAAVRLLSVVGAEAKPDTPRTESTTPNRWTIGDQVRVGTECVREVVGLDGDRVELVHPATGDRGWFSESDVGLSLVCRRRSQEALPKSRPRRPTGEAKSDDEIAAELLAYLRNGVSLDDSVACSIRIALRKAREDECRKRSWSPRDPNATPDVHSRLTDLVDQNFGTRSTMPTEKLLDVLEKEVPLLKAAVADQHTAVQSLIRAVWLYGGYKVNSRGPRGLLVDAIEILEPETAKVIERGDAGDDWGNIIERESDEHEYTDGDPTPGTVETSEAVRS